MASEVPNRHLVTAVTLTGLVGLLALFAVIGFNALFAPIETDGPSTSSPTCTPTEVPAGGKITTAEVTVSVYNASDRAGLASDTLSDLAERGFTLGDAGNAPDGTDVRYVQVWTTGEKDSAARLVALQFGAGTVVRVVSDELGAGVDVVVGEDFKGLVDDAPKSVRNRSTQEVCVPNE